MTIPNSLNVNFSAIVNTDQTTGTGVTIQDLRLEGNKANQSGVIAMVGVDFNNMGGGSGSGARQGAKILHVRSNSWYYNASSNCQGGHGICLRNSSNNTLTGNTVQENGGPGINLESSHNNTLTGNTAQGNNGGIGLNNADNNTVTGNTTQGNSGRGIVSSFSSSNTFSGNTMQGNSNGGISLSLDSNSTVSGNTIHDNGGALTNNGISMGTSDTNTIIGNTITDTGCSTNCYAIDISDSGSDNNYLAGNVFSTTSGTAIINDIGTGTIYAGQAMTAGGLDIRFKQAASASAFQIQSGAIDYLTADTSGNKIQIGSATTDANAILFGLDSYNNATDPTGYNGAMYYNSNTSKFRCYEGGIWTNCAGAAASAIQNQYAGTQTANFNIQSAAAAQVVAVIQGAASQSVDILQVKVSGGNIPFRVSSTGDVTMARNTLYMNTTTTNAQRIYISGNINSGAVSQYGIQNEPIFLPTAGAAGGNIFGFTNTAMLATSSVNIGQIFGSVTGVSTNADYTGTLTAAHGLNIQNPSMSGSKAANYYGISINGVTNNGGNTSGTIKNNQLFIGNTTVGAGAGGILYNVGARIVIPSGSGGTTHNSGLVIADSTASVSGTWSLYNSSAQVSYFASNVTIGTLLTADVTAGNVQIGSATTDATAKQFVLDSYNNSTDPTGVTGGMYYNSALAVFRRYENGAWKDCLTRHLVTLGSDITNNNATANTIANVTGLSFAVTSGRTYRFHANIVYTAAATTTGSRWSVNGPATSLLSYATRYGTTAATEAFTYASAYDNPAASNTDSPSTAGNTAIIEGIVTPSAGGTLTVRFASEVSSSAIVAKAGSTIEWW
ncbi:right-handed parallel beta-helix repeat-containing protein [Candidatus Saccharibacteria bacterium]|nr:MAG: right-handed parallel beta-helix repeat-containing protein [Candidatus Saccharibacteria bacterium]